ncbi:MAG: hypothetical protein ACYSWO_15510 [Planctomycetota bacterium]|jgi:uncharacterized Fe-S cluster-containing radical SAM superfamily protein
MANSANKSIEGYPRYLEPGFEPFDPLELAKQTEQIVCDGNRRKYTKFSCPRMYGGIATAYACGCCPRCIFCWVHPALVRNLEEEIVTPYPAARERLRHAGIEVDWE